MRSLNPTENLVTGPTKEPLDLQDVKKALIALAEVDETLVDGFISAARQRFESQTGRQIMTATWELWLDAFPCRVIELPRAPLQTITSIKYVAADGTLTTLDPSVYTVKASAGPQCDRGIVEPAYGQIWPSTRCEAGAVRIRYTAGYGQTYESVPELVKSALYLLVTDFFCSRCAADDKPAPKQPIGMDDLLGAFALKTKHPIEGWA